MLRVSYRARATASRQSRAVGLLIALSTLAGTQACSSRERRSLPMPASTATATSTATTTATATGTATGTGEVVAPGDGRITATESSTSTEASTSTSSSTSTATATDDGELPPVSGGDGVPTATATGGAQGANPDGHYDISGSNVVAQDLAFTIPSGWVVHQDAVDSGNVILGFARGTDYFRIYIKKSAGAFNLGSVVSGGTPRTETIGARAWQRADTQSGQVAVSAFSLEYQGHVYWGFGRAASAATATEAVTSFLTSVK